MREANVVKTNVLKLAAMGVVMAAGQGAMATDGVWNSNASTGNWSNSAMWLDSNIADGAGSIADFSQYPISVNHVITIDGAVASRTVGTLYLGDITVSDRYYTIAASSGGTLTLNNNGSTALVSQTAGSFGDFISAPIVLADNLSLANDSASKVLTVSGGITGAKNVSINAKSLGGITLSSTTINNTGTITNDGIGAGVATISAVIGTNVTGVIQNSAASQLTLSGSNTFTSGLTIKAGTVSAIAANALGGAGTGAVSLGAAGGTSAATLLVDGRTYANPITVQSVTSGTLTIGNSTTGDAVLSGGITLNNDLNLTGGAGGTLTVSGAVGGTRSLTNSSSGKGTVTISGSLGAGVTSVTQASASSVLTLSGNNSAFVGTTAVTAGILKFTSPGAGVSIGGTAVTVANGATAYIQTSGGASGSMTIAGNGAAGVSSGALEAYNTTSYAGQVSLAGDATISSDLVNTTFSLTSTTSITGNGYTLTVGGVGNTTLSGGLATGTGGLVRTGGGTLTLSAANSYTGSTRIESGVISLNHASALGGGGTVIFAGGALQHTATNTADYASRFVNSYSPVAINTNSQSVTYASGIAASNVGGLLKLGAGTLTLGGSNAYSGDTFINGGALAISTSAALPAGSTIRINSGGALATGGAYATLQGWLDSGRIATVSTGGLGISGTKAENIDFSAGAYTSMMLAAMADATYTGTITPAGSTYRVGALAGTLTLSNSNAFTGARSLVVGGDNVGGTVTLSASNDLTGATTIAAGTMKLSGAGAVAGSTITATPGATLNFTAGTSGSEVTRATGVALQRSTLTLTGAAADSQDAIGTLEIQSGASTVTLTANAGGNSRLNIGTYSRNAGSTGFFRGSSLGVNALADATNGAANISITTPGLVGGVLLGAYGDSTVGGTGSATTGGGLLTVDAINGLRLIAAGEYSSAVVSGQPTPTNVRYSGGSGVTTTTLTADTTINSLSFSNTVAGRGTTIQNDGVGGRTLTLNSGMIYAAQNVPQASLTGNDAMKIMVSKLNLGGGEGHVAVFTTNASGGTVSSAGLLQIDSEITGDGGNGITFGGSGYMQLTGTVSNSYTGTTTINGARIKLGKTGGAIAVPGNLVLNSGDVYNAGNQIADTATVTINSGTLYFNGSNNSGSSTNETIANLVVNGGGSNAGQGDGNTVTISDKLTMAGGTFTQASGAKTNVGGLATFSGGTFAVGRSRSTSGTYDGITTLSGGLRIINTASDPYSPIKMSPGSGTTINGGQLVLAGAADVTFEGNNTNLNTVTIESVPGLGSAGIIALNGSRTFNIGDGLAKNDLTVAPAITNFDASPSGLTKTGLGTLVLLGNNTYTGATTVNAGKLVVNGSLAGTISVEANGSLGGTGVFGSGVTIAGTLTPGNSPGTMTISSALTLQGTSTSLFELGASASDEVVGVTDITYGGALNVVLDGAGPAFAIGSTFDLFDWSGARSGQFASISLPSLPVGLVWQTWTAPNNSEQTFNYSTGEIAVVAIPEPTTITMLLTMGAGLLALRRRRVA